MLNSIFDNLFAKEYFEKFFKTNKRFPQSLVFEGSNVICSYFFALELARILNCKADKNNTNCNCTNCSWIKQGTHPSVVTVTPIDFKDDNTKSVISIKQVQKISGLINQTSDYHRFFIFANAKTDTPCNLKPYNNAGFFVNAENWRPDFLNRKILQEEAANALLKTIEEAPDNLTFIFLTDTKENLISTIVSRSLIFKFPAKFEKSNRDFSFYFKNYPDIPIENALELSKKAVENTADFIDFLDGAQNYLLEILKSNQGYKKIILSDIKKLEETKKQIQASILPKNAIETLFISLSNEGRKVLDDLSGKKNEA